eukprot:126066-Pelagomonas_calceolata.AAC.1
MLYLCCQHQERPPIAPASPSFSPVPPHRPVAAHASKLNSNDLHTVPSHTHVQEKESNPH